MFGGDPNISYSWFTYV